MMQKQINEILKKHNLWLDNAKGGERAIFNDATLRGANLRGANLGGANLRGANLGGANLRGANLGGAIFNDATLRGANLRGANLGGAIFNDSFLGGADFRHSVGNKKEIKSMQIDTYDVVYTNEQLAIGCKQYSIDKWRNFSDSEIIEMDDNALAWWNKWKDTIFKIIEMSPAEG